MAPEQDIRRHQKNMRGGFAGRSLDQKYVTPFLRKHNFPCMAQSGWLTRSLEQNVPYDFEYTGNIRGVKNEFLELVDKIEKQGAAFANDLLHGIFAQLVKLRENEQNLYLPRPKNKSVSVTVALVEKLWKTNNASRIPVIAIFAAYECLVSEISRYKNHNLLPLMPQNASDNKTRRAGDVDLAIDDKIVESVEIKHGIKIAPVLVERAIDKVKKMPVKRYYILSTERRIDQFGEISELTTRAKHNYGFEMIVNGVADTLKYYLRLVQNTDDFMEKFVSILEKDNDVDYALKKEWEKISDQQP